MSKTSAVLRYTRASGGVGEIVVLPETVVARGQTLRRSGIYRVAAKKPDFVARQENHVPPPARGLFGGLGQALGQAVVTRQLEKANLEDWTVICDYDGREYQLTDGTSRERAIALSEELARVLSS